MPILLPSLPWSAIARAQATTSGTAEPPPIPADRRITLAQALEIAARENPSLEASRRGVLAARANLSSQRAPINPTIGVGGPNNTVVSNLSAPSSYGVLFTVETNGARGYRTAQAKGQLGATEADLLSRRLDVRQGVANAYVDLQVANASMASEREAYATARSLKDLTEKQFALGSSPETDAIRARVALAQEESNLLKASSAVQDARANLDVQMGRDPGTPVDAADALGCVSSQPNLDRLRRLADENRPEVRSALRTLDSLRAAVGLQRSQYYPNVLLGTDLDSVKRGGVQVGLALPVDLGGIRSGVRQAQESVKAQEAVVTGIRQGVRLDVQIAYDALVRSQGTIRAFQDGILPRSESLLERIGKGYGLGASTILDLIDAQTTARSTRNDYVSALGDYRRALIQLERATGVSDPLRP